MVHCKIFFVITCCFAVSYQESFNLELNEKGISNEVSLKFTFNQKEIDLKLTLNELVTSKVPVFVGRESNQQLNISYWSGPDTKDFKSYHDPNSGASFIVLSDSTVQGIFRYDTKEYFIKPFNGRRKRRSANLYTAVEVKMDSYAKPPDREAKDNTAFTERVSSLLLEEKGTKMNYVVEVIMFVDFSIYKSWFTLSDQTLEASARHDLTIKNMKYYYACIANAMDTRYSSIREDDFSIRIKLNGVYIASTESSSPWTRDFMTNVSGERVLDVYQAIDDLPGWLKRNAGKFPQHDSVLVFTELSLFAGYSQGRPRFISGLANIKALCNEDAVSFNRDRGEFGTAGTASHELAHNLGSLHDNFQDNNCNPNDQYIMSPAPGEVNQLTFMHPFQFSSCSIDYFRQYLAALTYNKKNCLLQTRADLDVNIPTNVLLGQYIEIEQQCQLLYGKESYYCGGHDSDKVMCERLTCYNPIEMKCVTRVDQRAATGTTCGNKKWCNQGKCVSNSQGHAASDFCLHGDYKGPEVDCLKLISQDPSKCYQQSYFDKCCAFCEYIKSSDSTCPFGDKIPPYCADKLARDCYDDALRTQCCRSCYNLKKTSLQGCEYGNRAQWCDTASPSICYGGTTNCCELCAANHVGVSGCEYGDRVSWCNKSLPGHCSAAAIDCCLTCNPSFTKPPKPISIQKFVPTEPSTSPKPICPGDPSWCARIPPFYCYLDKSKSLCSCTCSGLQRNIKDCEFGDKHIWCKNLTKSQCQEIENPLYCCSYCSSSATLISQRTNLLCVMVLLAVFI